MGAKNKTKLAEAQEIASLEYTARLIDSRVDATSISATAESIADVLEDKGFTVRDKQIGGATNTITGVSLLDGTTPITTLNLNTGEEKTLKVSTTTNGGNANTEWYVQIDDKWHKIDVGENGVEIVKNGVASLDTGNNTTPQTIKISVTGMPENPTASVKKLVEGGEDVTIISGGDGVAVVKNDEIKITAGTSSLTGVTITVSVANVTPLNVGLTVTKVLAPTATTATPNTEIDTAYGTIDVIWLDTSNNIKSVPNAPILTSNNETMTKVTWTKSGTTWTEDSSPKEDWYSYNAVSTRETSGANSGKTTDNLTSLWANAKTKNNSYFVWIPRYAYRITYYSSDTSTEPTGYYDGYGMWKSDGSIKYVLDSGIETVTSSDGKKYIVHPAFETNLNNGGWSSELSGFWFAKYEMSGSTASALTSTYGTASQREQSIGTQYTNARTATYGFTGTLDSDDSNTSYMHSHLVKNSEWGAVAYLTHSQYGRNGNEITINDNSSYYRGGGSGTAYLTNTNQSTTGNPYGIYDMSGGAYEYVASYNKNYTAGSTDYFGASYGKDMVDAAKSGSTYISTKYITAYSGTSNNEGTDIYSVGITGDATKEVYTNTMVFSAYRNWFTDYSIFLDSVYPFFVRGAYCWDGAVAGLFYSNRDYGRADSIFSFRVVLVP